MCIQFLYIYMNSFMLISDTLSNMTINNPIFIFTVITVIWFIPGIVVRRLKEKKEVNIKNKNQTKSIERLYPKSKD